MWRKEEKVCFFAYGLRHPSLCVRNVLVSVAVLLLQKIHVSQEQRAAAGSRQSEVVQSTSRSRLRRG